MAASRVLDDSNPRVVTQELSHPTFASVKLPGVADCVAVREPQRVLYARTWERTPRLEQGGHGIDQRANQRTGRDQAGRSAQALGA